MRTVWISKFALSSGITEHACPESAFRDVDVYPGAPFAPFYGFVLGKEAHLTRDEAVKAAEAMRSRKIASLKKQIGTLENLSFE